MTSIAVSAGLGGVEELEKFNEFAAAVAFLDQGMDVTVSGSIPASGSGYRGVCTRDRASR
jgi:hypothetical protein